MSISFHVSTSRISVWVYMACRCDYCVWLYVGEMCVDMYVGVSGCVRVGEHFCLLAERPPLDGRPKN